MPIGTLLTDSTLSQLGFSYSQGSYWLNYKVEAVPDEFGVVIVIYSEESNIIKVSETLKYVHELEKYLDENEIEVNFSKFYSDMYGKSIDYYRNRIVKDLNSITSKVRNHAKELFGPKLSEEFRVTINQELELRVAFRNTSIPISQFIGFDRTSGFKYYVDIFTESELKRLNKR